MGKIFEIFLLWNCVANRNQILMEYFFGGPLSELYLMTPLAKEDHWNSRHSFNKGPYGKNFKNLFVWNCLANRDQTLMEWSLDGWPYQNNIQWSHPQPKLPTSSDMVLTYDPMEKMFKNLFRKCFANEDQKLSELYIMIMPTNQDCYH